MPVTSVHGGGAVCSVWLAGAVAAMAADWQWSSEVAGVISSEHNKPPRAFLWVPPQCAQVRGVVVGQHNMEEEDILEHPAFRRVMGEIGFAEVWISPGIDRTFDYTKGAGEHFDGMMHALAELSGYSELADAPVVPIGHSACASFPWNFALWNPGRTLAAVSVSGQWPWYEGREADKDAPVWGDRSIDGVPGLVTMGEYEWAEANLDKGLTLRSQHPKWALSAVGEAGGGHFDCSDRKASFIAEYIRAAAKYRLPAVSPRSGPVPLTPIDPTSQGWVVERSHMNRPPAAPPAAVGHYTGDVAQTFWCFDETMATATASFAASERGKQVQLIGYSQKDGLVPQTGGHNQVRLHFEPIDDGLTFKVTGAFLDTVPQGRPEKWAGKPKDSAIAHGSDPQNISISRICGPITQLAPDTFAIRFYRMGMDNPRRSGDIWMLAEHPGDGTYRRIIQQSQMGIPLKNTAGAEQAIAFPEIADQRIGVQEVPLAATSSAGAKVHYYVLAGPAEVIDDTHLAITGIPPRAKLPISITVVAWQWGRTIDPKLKGAEPVTRTFTIGR